MSQSIKYHDNHIISWLGGQVCTKWVRAYHHTMSHDHQTYHHMISRPRQVCTKWVKTYNHTMSHDHQTYHHMITRPRQVCTKWVLNQTNQTYHDNYSIMWSHHRIMIKSSDHQTSIRSYHTIDDIKIPPTPWWYKWLEVIRNKHRSKQRAGEEEEAK